MKFFIFLCVMIGALPAFAQFPAKVDSKRLKPGDRIPNIVSKTLKGADFNLKADLKGKVVLIDFWATWCGPCVAETPNIKKSYDKWHDKGFEVVAISLDGDPQKARDYVADKGLSWINLCDGLEFKSPSAQAFSVRGIPCLLLLGRDGHIFAANARGAQLTEMIELAMSGDGVARQAEVDGMPQVSDEANSVIAELDAALSGDDEVLALQVSRKILREGSLSSEVLARIAYKHGNKVTGLKNLKALYLIASAPLEDGIITSEEQQTAGVARAHAAIELEGAYVAKLWLRDLKGFGIKMSDDIMAVKIHLGIKSGKGTELVSTLLAGVKSNQLRYDQVKGVLNLVGPLNLKIDAEAAGMKQALDYWMSSQEGLPSDRASVTVDGKLLSVSYAPRNTNLAGVLELNAMVRINGSQFFAIPMSFGQDGRMMAEMPIDDPSQRIELYFQDRFGRSDTNEGRYWSVN